MVGPVITSGTVQHVESELEKARQKERLYRAGGRDNTVAVQTVQGSSMLRVEEMQWRRSYMTVANLTAPFGCGSLRVQC